MTIPFRDPTYEQTVQHAADPAEEQDPTIGQKANLEVAPNPVEQALGFPAEDGQKALARALYGSCFPLSDESYASDDPGAWVNWVREMWADRRASVEMPLHLVERNRLMRAGQQFISSQGIGPWKEPIRPAETSRVVHNLIAPALDARLHVITEQRPGFSVSPMTLDPDDQRKAEARQAALDFQYESQGMAKIIREGAYWAQTDGVSFLHTYWDDQAGPWDERMGDLGMKKPLGDLRTQVVRIEQVRVSANASATQDPYFCILREVIPAQESAQRYGQTGALASGQNRSINGASDDTSGVATWVLNQSNPGEADRLKNTDTVERFTMYVAPHPDLLPTGLQLTIVGDAVVVGPKPLFFKTIPLVRVPDGSADPSYFPRPIMEQWIGHQQRINALLSNWVDAVRINKGGRFLAKPGAITKETFLGGLTSVVEVTGAANINDAVSVVPSFSVGQDLKELLALEIKAFEDLSGYNDASRGSFSGETSGRAIIAQREQLERIYAPSVVAIATAMTAWGKVQLAGMAWGYDVARDMGAVGRSRPDLARALKSSDFDGACDVKVEPETLMPMPKAMRLFMLDELFAKRDQQGNALLTAQDYRRLMPFAMLKQIQSADSDQEARANRVADALLMRGMVPPMRWQDNEAIHQDILERKILLQDDVDEDVIQAANARWMELANQAAMKQGGMPPAPTGGQPSAGGGSSPFAPSPATQPLASSLPGIAAEPTVQGQATAMFEAQQPQ